MTDGSRSTTSDAARRLPRRLGAYLGAAALASAAVAVDSGIAADSAFPRAWAASAAQGDDKGAVGWDAYRDPSAMAEPRGGQTKQFSSFDRSGGNDDGFNGTYSCLRTTDQGCVIAEKAGAGEVSSIWFTHEPQGDVRAIGNITIELDGQTVLHAPLQDVVDGKIGAPFVTPLVSNAADNAGGVAIKVPMPYRNSMRITTDKNPDFYHVDYREFADPQGVQTFNPSDPATDVIDRMRRFGLVDPKGGERNAAPVHQDLDVPAGGSAPAATVNGPGQINQLRIKLPQTQANPNVVDDGRAFGPGGSSRFQARVAPNNQGVRVVRRYDPQVADQVGQLTVDGQPAGQWNSGPARPGQWGVQALNVAPQLTAGKSAVDLGNAYTSSSKDFNEFRYDVQSLVNGQWVRTDVVDVGPNHPSDEQTHGYRIQGQTFSRDKLQGTYPTPAEQVQSSNALMQQARLRISFDGQTTVDAPIGELFGSGLGKSDVRSMMSSIDAGQDGWMTSWWPMPFARNARVELVNGSDVPIKGASVEVTSAPKQVGDDVRYFHASHHAGPTQQGQDWNLLDAKGAGTFYGTTQTMRGKIPANAPQATSARPLSANSPQANQSNYLEGDERFYTNGSSSPAWHGTGTEDFYESGWYFRDGTPFNSPMTSSAQHENGTSDCQYDCTTASRQLVPDAVPFTNGFSAGIEHGPNDDEAADYSSTAYWYGGQPATQHPTDTVDPTDSDNRDQHDYDADGEQTAGLNSSFEGNRNPQPFGRNTTTATGPISFQAALDPQNRGAVLRRLSDQAAPYQAVQVRVDGQPAGTWSQPLGNKTHRWLEDDFQLPAALTQGKSSARIDLVPVQGAPPWSASQYTVLSQ
jgi:hypothetical protein